MTRFLWVLLWLIFAPQVFAWDWHSLWVTKDKQAQELMEQGKFAEAKDTFLQEDWRAAAAYRAKDYQQAVKQYQSLHTDDAFYNQGNALAYLGQLDEAIKAYNKALSIHPGDKDALYNRKILEDLKKKNQQQKQDKQNQDKENDDKQGQDKQGQDKQGQDKQGQDKQDQDKQGQDKPGQDKQGQDNKESDGQPSSAVREQQQAKEQWLGLIPDDPGGLMREKFLRDHLRRQRGWYQ